MRLARLIPVFAFVSAVTVPARAAAQLPAAMTVPAPGPATDRASVMLVMRAVNERLAAWMASASVSDSASAWLIQTPSGGGAVWGHAHAWLVATLRAREPESARESPQHFVKVTSAVVRGDSLEASFYLGSMFPDQHKSPATVYRVRAKWGPFGWGTPVVEVTAYLD